ncbi:hypothetical protein JCM11251_005526 [Rhodosporidiobolus azoricus]
MGSALSAAVLPATSPSRARSKPYEPTYDDVLDVLDELTNRCNLPVELAILILDQAEYHPVIRGENRRTVLVQAGWQGHKQQQTLFVTDPIPAFPTAPSRPVQKVEIWTESRDQGFSSFQQYHGTRAGSSSWFELVLLRPDTPPEPPPSSLSTPPSVTAPPTPSSPSRPPLPGSFPLPPPLASPPAQGSRETAPTRDQQQQDDPTYSSIRTLRLHSNIHASPSFARFSAALLPYIPPPLSPLVSDESEAEAAGADLPPPPIDLAEAAAFVAELQPGDRLALVALAEYPMWVNAIRGCGIRVQVKAV